MDAFTDALQGWDGEQVTCRFDRPTGTWIFIASHSTALGPACGGTRMRTYPRPLDGLTDALALGAAMTRKMAVAGLPCGGGKAVLAVPELLQGAAREGLLERYVDLVESLRGGFLTGPDMNIGAADLDLMAARSEHVFGTGAGVQEGRTISDATAIGTLAAIRACLRHRFGGDALRDRRVLVQGLGGVGGELVGLLVAAGARVLVSDVDATRQAELVGRLGVEPIDAADVLTTPCDVFAPCAIGGVIGPEDVATLAAPIVCGSANNPLRTAETADALGAAGILFAPDYVVNGGGALHAIGVETFGWSSSLVLERLEAIGDTLLEVFRLADAHGVSTAAAAERLAGERLAAARSTGAAGRHGATLVEGTA